MKLGDSDMNMSQIFISVLGLVAVVLVFLVLALLVDGHLPIMQIAIGGGGLIVVTLIGSGILDGSP